MIKLTSKGDFSKVTKYFQGLKNASKLNILDKYGAEGVRALSSATPVKTGLTANSWYYEIKRSSGTSEIEFKNSNVNDGVLIAVILQHGHGTRNGGWVAGRDYINPAIQPIFDKIVEEAWKEVTKL